MESKHIQRVTFAELADAKAIMVMVAGDLEHKWSAYQTMKSLGVRNNSGAMAEARRDISDTIDLMITVASEFRRLHVDCPCSTTDEEIAEGIAELRRRETQLATETAEAGPVDTDPVHAIGDLQKFLGAVGLEVPEGFDRQDVPGLRYDGNDGTGLYL
jgi:hypothetical protein